MNPTLGILHTGIKLKAAIAITVAVSIWGLAPALGQDPIVVTAHIPQVRQIMVPLTDARQAIDLMSDRALWQYLRKGLNFVETSGEEVAPDFVHPGGVAYGAVALTRIAIQDVIQHSAEFAAYTVDDILDDSSLYEQCALYYADLLLRHYLKVQGIGMTKEEIFDILQKAWFLGPNLYKKGRAVPGSREKNARSYMQLAAGRC